MENKKVLLSVKDLHVKFRVRGRILSAIRGISLDLYEGESIAIVGESGSGKSVFTKTFAGMLETNGFIDQGSIIFNDDELSDTHVKMHGVARFLMNQSLKSLNRSAKLENGAAVYQQIQALKAEREARLNLSPEEQEKLTNKIDDLTFRRTELFNQRQTIESSKEKERYKEATFQLKQMDAQIEDLKVNGSDSARPWHEAIPMRNPLYGTLRQIWLREADGDVDGARAALAELLHGETEKELERDPLLLYRCIAKMEHLSAMTEDYKSAYQYAGKRAQLERRYGISGEHDKLAAKSGDDSEMPL